MRVLILGGDGYLGWPTSMHLSAKGHSVMAIDNYLRRNLSRIENCEMLYEVPNLFRRAEIWKENSNRDVTVKIGDLADWHFVSTVFQEFQPEALVHYAEQPSAPYSMKSREAASLTLEN